MLEVDKTQLNAKQKANPESMDFDSPELRSSILSPLLIFIYRALGCQRRWRLGRILLNVVFRFEEQNRSATARKIMWQFHGVKIGTYSYGSCFDPVNVRSGVTVGRYSSLATGVRIFLQNHPMEKLSTHPYFYSCPTDGTQSADLDTGALEIGNDVWIGCNVIILPGCQRIGNGAVIGAGAVVTKDVPDFCIVAGNPAKRIRDRFSPRVVERLQAAQWWQMPIEEVQLKMRELQKLIDLDAG